MLIKSTLSSDPTYFMFLFPLLDGIATQMDKIQRDFFIRWYRGRIKMPFSQLKYCLYSYQQWRFRD